MKLVSYFREQDPLKRSFQKLRNGLAPFTPLTLICFESWIMLLFNKIPIEICNKQAVSKLF